MRHNDHSASQQSLGIWPANEWHIRKTETCQRHTATACNMLSYHRRLYSHTTVRLLNWVPKSPLHRSTASARFSVRPFVCLSVCLHLSSSSVADADGVESIDRYLNPFFSLQRAHRQAISIQTTGLAVRVCLWGRRHDQRGGWLGDLRAAPVCATWQPATYCNVSHLQLTALQSAGHL